MLLPFNNLFRGTLEKVSVHLLAFARLFVGVKSYFGCVHTWSSACRMMTVTKSLDPFI